MPQEWPLTNDKVPGRGEHQGAGQCDAVQGEARWSGPQTAIVKQPNEATAQAEVDRSAVCYDTIMTLQWQEVDDNKCSVVEGFPIVFRTFIRKKGGKHHAKYNIYLFQMLLVILQLALPLYCQN